MRTLRHSRLHRLAAYAALIALGFCALIPVGYMPDVSGNGHGLMPLVICDGTDHAAIHHGSGQHHHEGHNVCPYSSAAVYALGGFTPALPAAPIFMSLPAAIPSLSATLPQAPFAGASPRSPPVFS